MNRSVAPAGIVSSVSTASAVPLWLDQRLDPSLRSARAPSADPEPSPLAGASAAEADVVIVGGGLSGLWTAYYLARLDPSLRIVVLERAHCGFGASGRNGGWCVGELAGSFEAVAARSGPSEALRLARAAFDAVDEVGRVCAAEGIDAQFAKGGTIRVARNEPQARRQREEISHHRSLGFTEDEICLLGAQEARSMMGATGVRSGIFLAPSAALHPGRLVGGLVDVVESSGVTIAEGVEVIEMGDHWVKARPAGSAEGPVVTIRASTVVRATEAYTRDLPGSRRELIPVYSLMVATEPLGAEVFAEIGLAGRPTFTDDRYLVIYGQRTADDRLAFGGRGVPYLFGSRIEAATEQRLDAHRLIASTLAELFPVVAQTAITHRWGGVLAIARNWLPFVRHDRVTGRAELGGYVGEGVAGSNLAGRTLAELICGHDTPRTSLPLVGVRSRRWEPEPLRWIGVRSSRGLLVGADDFEHRTGRSATPVVRLARMLRNPPGLRRPVSAWRS
jgi:glycine/D-amino acid oxidase-like deaminating enzyme